MSELPLTVCPLKYAPYLRNYATTLGTVAFAKIDGATDDSALLMKKIWNVAIGQE